MVSKFEKSDILKWADIIYKPDIKLIKDISLNWSAYKKIFIDKVAQYLYEDMRRARMLITLPFTFNKAFSHLRPEEKAVWYNYASVIPEKLKLLNLFIQPFSGFCKTCIITDMEIEKLAFLDHENYYKVPTSQLTSAAITEKIQIEKDNTQVSFQNLPGARKWYFRELNYLIPPQLKKIGYEIIRPEEVSEIDLIMIRKLARAIHSRYLQEMKSRDPGTDKDLANPESNYPGDTGTEWLTDFENLPDEIQYSNWDNAFHIPTKLLSIGFKTRQVKKGFKAPALHLNEDEVETMASVEHLRWSWDKRLNGWIYGNVKDNTNKTHPGLIPYEELTESEKEKDRELVKLIPALLQDIDCEAYPVNPDQIKMLSYAIKPQSSIHKLLNETRRLNEELKDLVSTIPELEEKVRLINKNIEETISEVQGSYNYAQHIQKTFLPDDLYIRECFPDSFVLFKPKDIVSGDFYFFSKREHLITFAAVDCTGHGIPGAILSTIGYGTIDRAVNDIKLSEPHKILHHLFSRVHRFLRFDEDGMGLSDDMDIALCTLDTSSNMLSYSSVGNPLYLVTDNQITEFRANNSSCYCNEKEVCPFVSQYIQLKAGDTVYLCSDGYTDQFGGKNHKKYLNSRFKSFLLSIQGFSMPEQNDKLYEEIERWREENEEDQTDDILVMGIRI